MFFVNGRVCTSGSGTWEGPAQCLTFLGIELDTVAMTSRLPRAKLHDLRARVRVCIGKRKVLLRDLQSLVGHLNFACKVVAPGQAFFAKAL